MVEPKKQAAPVVAAANDTDNKSPVIIDLGKKRSKLVKQLAKGNGKLMTVVNDCLAELKENSVIAADSQPVIIVVEKKRRMRFPRFF